MFPIEFLWRAAQRFPERPAIIAPEGEMSFRELARRVVDRAGALSKLDPSSGGVVCVGASNTPEHLLWILSVLAAGKVWTPLNPRGGDPELRRIIDFVRPALVLVDEGMRPRVDSEGLTIRLFSEVSQGAGETIAMGPVPHAGFALDRTQAIKFTGGTTGFPKGVKQPLRAWNTNIVTQMHAMRLSPDDRYLVAAPLTHGTSTFMLPVLGSGGALIFPDAAKPLSLLDAAERHDVSLFFAPPTLIQALVDEQRRSPRNLRSLRLLVYGGAPMRREQIRDAQGCFGPVVCTSYGQTEAPQVATFLPPEQMTGDDLASVGRPTFLTQVGIFGSDGQALPNGRQGEIALRGDLVMTGYLNAPEETARTLKDGWLFTGDAGVIDERGYLFIKDRIRDVIITGGFNVYPSDVEVVISAQAGIVDCAVIGMPDEKWGEAVHAAVQVRPGSTFNRDQLAAVIKHELGSVKTPKEIHVFETLPKSPVGKVLKAEIRDEIVRRRSSKAREDAV